MAKYGDEWGTQQVGLYPASAASSSSSGRGLGQAVDPEDQQRQRRAWLHSAVAVVNVDLLFAQPRSCAAQLARTVRKPDYGDVRLLEDHAQAAQHRLGAGRIIRHESGQALALLYIRLKRQDVHSTLRQSEEALPQGARFVFDRYCKLLRLRHLT